MTPEEWAEVARVKMGLAPNREYRWAACAEVIRAAEADAFRAGAEAMREAVAVMIETWKPINWHGWRADEVPEYLVTNVRALPLPEPPDSGGGEA